MPIFSIDIDVYCGACGAGNCHLAEMGTGRIDVDVCPSCCEDAKQEGYDEGHNDGYHQRDDDVAELEARIEGLETELLKMEANQCPTL